MTQATIIANEKIFMRVTRKAIGVLLAAEAALMAQYALFSLIFTPFIGGLAFLGGAGNTTDKQIHTTWLMIALMTIAPLIITFLMAIAAMSILQRKRPVLIVIIGLLLITVQVAFQYLARLPFFNITTMLVMLIPMASIFIGFTIKRVHPLQHTDNCLRLKRF